MSEIEAAVLAEREEERMLGGLQPSAITAAQGKQYVRCFARLAKTIGHRAAHESCLAAAMDEPARYAVLSGRGLVVGHSRSAEAAHRTTRRRDMVGSSVSYNANRAGESMVVAETILSQLGGGGRLRAMIGARDFSGGANVLTFRFTAKAKNGANNVRVTLEPSDTYKVEFHSVRGRTVKLKGSFDDIYAEDLILLFERETGLFLSL